VSVHDTAKIRVFIPCSSPVYKQPVCSVFLAERIITDKITIAELLKVPRMWRTLQLSRSRAFRVASIDVR